MNYLWKASLLLLLMNTTLSADTPVKPLRVLVYPFENIGTKEYSWLSAGMTGALTGELGKIGGITVIGDDERKRALAEMELEMKGVFASAGPRVGKLTGADVVFTGNYVVVGGRIRVLCKLVRTETGVIETGAKIDGKVDDIYTLQEQIADALLNDAARLSFTGVKKPVPAARARRAHGSHPCLEAYRSYSMGLEIRDRDPRAALTHFRQALVVSPDYIEAQREAGYTAGALLSMFNEGLALLKKAGESAEKTVKEDYMRYADILIHTGSVYDKKGDHRQALVHYEKARRLFEKYDATLSTAYANVLNSIGVAYSRHGRLDKALKYYEESRKIRERQELRYTVEYAVLLGNIGIIHSKREELDSSLDYALKSKAVRDHLKLENTTGYAVLLDNIGSVHTKKGAHDKALEYRLRSKAIRDRRGLRHTEGYAVLLANIGVDYSKKKDHAAALRFYTQSRAIRDRLGMGKTYGYAILLSNIGYEYAHTGDLGRALGYYAASEKLFGNLESTGTVNYAILLFNMAWVYNKKGDSARALELYERALDLFGNEGYAGYRKAEAQNAIKRLRDAQVPR